MGKPSAPPAPDYAAAATAQGQQNVQSAQTQAALNNPNINSPFGSQQVSYSTDAYGNMVPTINQSLTPIGQQDLQNQQAVQYGESQLAQQGLGQAQSVLNSPFSYNGPGINTNVPTPGSLNYGPNASQYATNAGPSAQTGLDLSGIAQPDINAGTTAYQAQMNLLQPNIQQSQLALQQQLANQGITPGSDAFNNATRAWGQQTGALEDNAALNGVGLQQSANQQGFNQQLSQAGLYNTGLAQNFGQQLGANAQNFGQQLASAGLYNQNQNQAFNQALQGQQFGNNATQQAYAQALSQYNQPLNEITALMSGSQIQAPQFQQYTGGGNVQAAPTFQAATDQGNYNTAAYNSQMQALAGLYSGLGSAAGMFAGK